ncbi:hypothetical protein BJ875DRAFT_35224 [Amylocarpus encephaloides]|uniref:Mid2 domain-containing protein n=1 Tax=Amylocarpus encephaloides TaxID=45428 RepID=A0A9P8C514_9HELO|nr:hypothetical protein BJ875DRAFT_35224 [Amylocarpus encephaloides]
MLSPSQLRLLSVLALLSLAQASAFNAPVFVRQDSSTQTVSQQVTSTVVSSSAPSSSVSSSSEQQQSTSTVVQTSTQQVSSSSQQEETSSTPTTPQASSTPTTSNQQQSTSSQESSTPTTSSPSQTKGGAATTTSNKKTSTLLTDIATITPTVDIVTQVLTVSGSTFTSLSSSTDTAGYNSATSAAAAASSSAASLAQNDSKDDGGMSDKTRNTIIGVVVGVGGAAIFAGLFLVAWRIWGRKKKTDENDGLMGFGGASETKPALGSGSTATATPFQSTLETYHNPARGNVNASSNF